MHAWCWITKMGEERSWSCSFAQPKGCGNALLRAGTLTPNPHLCSVRLGLHPAPRTRCCQALDVWEGREAAGHIQTRLPGGDKLVPLGQCGRVQALGVPQHPKERQKAHKSHCCPLSILGLHNTAGWDVKGSEAAHEKPLLAGCQLGG